MQTETQFINKLFDEALEITEETQKVLEKASLKGLPESTIKDLIIIGQKKVIDHWNKRLAARAILLELEV